MKKLRVICLLLCLDILCAPICTYAGEGLSWTIVSDGTADEADSGNSHMEEWEIGNDTDDKTGSANEDKSGNAESEDNEKADEKTESENKPGEDSEKDDEKDKPDSDRKKSDADSDDDQSDDALKGDYPSGNIYSDSEIKEMIDEKYKELESAYEIRDRFKKTKTIDSIDSFILNFCGDPLSDKKIVFLGDSITAGNGGTLTPDGSGLDYTNFIAKYTEAEIVNLGIGGAPFEGNDNDDALVHRYTDIPGDADIIVLFAGINDLFAGSENFGSLDELEEGTYCGDIYQTFKQIHKLHPDADIHVVITYPNKMEEYKEYINENWQDYADVQIELAEKFDFHVINLYEEGFMDSGDSKIRNAFFKDDIHPDDLGSEILGRHILVHLIENYI
jgi:lysophospholipase L1-like esterase